MDFFSFIILLFAAAIVLNILIGRSKKSDKDLRDRKKDILERHKEGPKDR